MPRVSVSALTATSSVSHSPASLPPNHPLSAIYAQPVHADVITRFMEVQYVLMAPITPHFCEHVWGGLLGKAGSVTSAPWPAVSAPMAASASLLATDVYLSSKLHAFRVQIAKAVTGAKPGKAPKAGSPAAGPPKAMTHVVIYVARSYAPWQAGVLRLLAGLWDGAKHPREAGYFPPDALATIKAAVLADPALKPLMKKAMEFANLTILSHRDRAPGDGPSPALGLTVPFDEAGVWGENVEYVRKSLGIPNVIIKHVEDEGVVAGDPSGRAKEVVPGEPAVFAYAE
jgi:leucyl-tRNA synthetase